MHHRLQRFSDCDIEFHIEIAHHGNITSILDLQGRLLKSFGLLCLNDLASDEFAATVFIGACGISEQATDQTSMPVLRA